MKNTIAVLFALIIVVCLATDSVNARGRSGGGAKRSSSSISKSFSKLNPDDGPSYSSSRSYSSRSSMPYIPQPDNSQSAPTEQYSEPKEYTQENETPRPPIDPKDIPSDFPEKLRDRIVEQRKKTNFTFGSVLTCICENKVMFTNLVCMPCAGEEILHSSVSQL